MSILYEEQSKIFVLETKESTYQMKIAEFGYVEHLYYGKKIEGVLAGENRRLKRSFVCNPNEAGRDRVFTIDTLQQEYPMEGVSDFRAGAVRCRNADGSCAIDLRYKTHKIFRGKYSLEGLPGAYGNDFDTLQLVLEDRITKTEIILLYGVSEEYNVITRAAKIKNNSIQTIVLEKAMSLCLELDNADYDLLSFYGHWTGERRVERKAVRHGRTVIENKRGVSSHHYNPTAVLAERNADETKGECFGFAFVYSGNFSFSAEVDSISQTRFLMGMEEGSFRFVLESEETFTTPETLMIHSDQGLGKLSRDFHKLIRNGICRGKYKNSRRPVLINNWEATKMEFDEEILYDIAKRAAELGVELFVMDDGWFGKRDDDYSSLGDWQADQRKFPNGLKPFVEKINKLPMQFGIWVEPEMVNEDSDLYRKHPEWCLHIPGRKPARGRYQLVLDLARREVREYIYTSMKILLNSANISYVKWDMNRAVTDVWSEEVSAERMGEISHRYVLGLYEILERLIKEFPDVLWEGCCSGGGRFDAGMLYYMPQIWCSDNTDAIARAEIQYGTSFFYPTSTMGAHVSACPNQQTGRTVNIDTRAAIAYYGTFGYELDLQKISEEETEKVRKQISFFKNYYDVLMYGEYYRLKLTNEDGEGQAWCSVGREKTTAILCFLQKFSRSNASFRKVYIQGLKEKAYYRIQNNGSIFSGSALQNAGITLPVCYEDNKAQIWVLEEIDSQYLNK